MSEFLTDEVTVDQSELEDELSLETEAWIAKMLA